MRVARFVLLICLFVVTVPAWAQQTQNTSPPNAQPDYVAPKDAQAVEIVNQALAVAGGTAAILAITDYTASGAITYHQGQDVQGTATFKGLGFTEFRQDATLPSGVQSFSIHDGLPTTKDGAGHTRHYNFRYQPPLMTSSILVPSWQLAAALNDPLFGLSYKGVTEINGYAVFHIRIQMMPPGPPDPNGIIAEYFGADFFIDKTTLQVRATQDVVIDHLSRTTRFSNYQAANGVLVPFSIDEEINGQRTQTIQLQQISFNTGLQGSDFQL